MSDYLITEVSASDWDTNEQILTLLEAEGIHRDNNLDYTCAMFDEEMRVIATGSCFFNTLRCLAVSNTHQGEGLMNQMITHLVSVQFARGNTHLFLYTKYSTAPFFADLGFYEIASIKNQIVFMENKRNGFSSYLKKLEQDLTIQNIPLQESAASAKNAAIVLNANPFTLGHQYLVEKAAHENDILHLFIVEEDASLIPFSIRKKLVIEGTSHLTNIIYHDSGPYMISNATFPGYFQKDEREVMESHAELDLAIFTKIAEKLHISMRYIGKEPFSETTAIYNKIMAEKLPENGIDCIIVPRKQSIDTKNGIKNIPSHPLPISASIVRQAIKNGNLSLLKELVPETTLQYLKSEEAIPVVKKIQQANYVIHH